MGRICLCSACLSALTQNKHTAVQVWRELTAVWNTVAHIRKLNQAEFEVEAKIQYIQGENLYFYLFFMSYFRREPVTT